jgi:ABC-type phosphate/phosphonate transport system substrate-binding protein
MKHGTALASELGVSKFFLATDNRTVMQSIANEYPEYAWYVHM